MTTVLIVDDDQDISEALASILELRGYAVTIAEDGLQGLAALDLAIPDLLLLDVEMPILDGPGMAYRMLIENCGREQIPIVLVSGVGDLSAVALRVGTPYTLRKPFHVSDLYAVIDRALDERAVPTPLRVTAR